MNWRSIAWKLYAALCVFLLVEDIRSWNFDGVLAYASFAISVPVIGGVTLYAWARI